MFNYSINEKKSLTTTSGNNILFFQPKLFINQPNDVYEQEANAKADKVMQASSSHQPFFSPSAIQRKKESHQATSSSQTENHISSLQGGKSLSNKEKMFFESRMGYDFSNVRIHNDSDANQSAKNINALAYTHGNDIVFGSNQYQPDTDEGKKLLAHELTHVIQQQNFLSIQRQAKPGDTHTDVKATTEANYYIALILKGAFNSSHDMFGMTQHGEQKFSASDMMHDEGACLNGSSFTADINFCRGAPNTAVNAPITALAIEYKERGHFTSLKTARRDENPVPDITTERTCWQPNFPNHFKFDVYKRGTLTVTAELFGTDNNELNIYSDTIEIEKCAAGKKCSEDAVATNRWLVIPDNGGPMHPLGPSDPDDGEHYEIYAVTGTENYFICKGESMNERIYVDRRGYAL